MKVTANIPDEIINDVKSYSHGKNITDSLLIALKEWLSIQKIRELNKEIKKNPLEFKKDFSADKTRNINRTS